MAFWQVPGHRQELGSHRVTHGTPCREAGQETYSDDPVFSPAGWLAGPGIGSFKSGQAHQFGWLAGPRNGFSKSDQAFEVG